MSYRLTPTESGLEPALHRLARGQLEKARAALTAEGEALHAGTHDARKRLKKLRGLVRLLRGALPRHAEANAALRDTGRLLSGFRDATALIDTLDRLGERGGRPGQEAAQPLRDTLIEARRATLASDELAEGLAAARDRLEALSAEVADWRLEADGWAAVAPGLGRSYARARAAAKAARDDPAPDTVHEWRKRMKDHWYHTRLLRDIWPEAMAVRGETLSRLTELLGQDHDIAVLRPHLAAEVLGEDAQATLGRLADRLAAEHRAEAQQLGARVLADRPKALKRRWKALWRAAAATPT